MQGLKFDLVARRALRARVCTICRFRPDDSEALPPTVARECERNCPIFANIAPLTEIATRFSGETRARFEQAIADGICLQCTLSLSAGDFCAERFSRTCPLSCYAANVLQTLEEVEAARPVTRRVAGGI